MLQLGRYRFRWAETPDEFEQIHRLNFRTFVEEIPQHSADEPDRLVDKFHAKNRYLIAETERRVVGMVAVHDRAPFSIAGRLPDPAILTQAGARPLEVRLLAVEPEHRNGPVMLALAWLALEYARPRYDAVYISGVFERVPLYERIGFCALGPPVADGAARFVPMCATFPLPAAAEQLAERWRTRLERGAGTHGAGGPALVRPVDLRETRG